MDHPRVAMLLAAGLGTRMRPLTEATAKPLLKLAGSTLLDHALDRLAAVGVERVVVNAHWHAEQVAAHLARRVGPPETVVRHEPQLLNTGGAVAAALDVLGAEPFFVMNGDTFWLDGPRPALERLLTVWDSGKADGVLLLHRTFQTRADTGPGDFAMDPMGLVRRRREREVVPFLYGGVQLVAPALLAGAPAGAFSMGRA
jgi:MurNAc alpha-1-phosphate uridylyltransferase